jgi:hypothetical protein
VPITDLTALPTMQAVRMSPVLPSSPDRSEARLATTTDSGRRSRAASSAAARHVLAVFVAAHGVAHLAGTGDAFSRASERRSADDLAGGWTVSDPATLRALGVAWTVVAVAFVGVAVVTWTGRRAWPRALWSVALASLALLLVALWSSAIGVVIDLGLLGVAWRAGAFASPERTAR